MHTLTPGIRAAFVTVLLFTPALYAQSQSPRDPAILYTQFCASCHGANHEGGLGGSLVKGPWKYGNNEAALIASITTGYPAKEMPGFTGVFTAPEITALAKMLRTKITAAASSSSASPPAARRIDEKTVVRSELHPFRVETFVDGLKEPWGMAFLPDGRALVTERNGGLRLIVGGKLDPEPVTGIPDYDIATGAGAQAGLFDVAIHPEFAKNNLVYLSFAGLQPGPREKPVNMTRVIRARLDGHALVELKDIFLAPNTDYGTNGNFGGRMALDGKGYIYFAIGDRGQRQNAQAQNLTLVTGKIHRLHDDGRVPADNPFVNTPGAVPSIWAYGVRNPQGLCFEPATGDLWETEHGMKGGDEFNLIRKGLNYGWPFVTDGTDYGGKPPSGAFQGKPFAAVPSLPGMEPPVVQWTPSPAVCGVNFYTGDRFPKWKGNAFVVSLAKQQVRRLEIKGARVEKDEIVLSGIGRLRQFLTGPDGLPYLLCPDRVVRLVPSE